MGDALALFAAFAWAVNTVAMRPLAGRLLFRASFARMALGTLVAVACAWVAGSIPGALAASWSAWGWLFASVLGSLIVGDSVFYMASARIGVSRALPIASSFPLFSAAGAAVFLDESISPTLAAGGVLVVAGVALIAADRPTRGHWDWVGIAMSLFAALCWATIGLTLKPALEHVDEVGATMLRFAMATAAFAIVLACRRQSPAMPLDKLALAAVGGLVTSASAFAFIASIALVGVARSVILSAVTPVFSALLARWFLDERIGRRAVYGIGVTAAGSMLLAL